MLASAVKPVACHAKIDEKFTKIQAGGDSYNDKHCLSNRARGVAIDNRGVGVLRRRVKYRSRKCNIYTRLIPVEWQVNDTMHHHHIRT
jgi:hypothetical protein